MKENYFHEEEQFHSRDRKQYKKERRHAQETDRSKYKKTDAVSPIKKEILERDPNLRRGRIIAITGEGILVKVEDISYRCSLKGLIKKEKMLTKNLIAVGDLVQILPIDGKEGTIVTIEERYSMLSRQDISGKKEQFIAVNIDQVLIIASIDLPPLKPALIDRFAIAAESGHMQPVIVINKIDQLETTTKEERARYQAFLIAYETLGYPVLSVSAKTDIGMESLRTIMKNKASALVGQSGVGKTSLLNAAFGFERKTGDLATKTYKGSHTTTMAQLLPLPDGGFCIDTPGIRSFGVWAMKREQLIEHYREFLPFANHCRYANCTHLTEPSCAVQEALEQGHISSIRYESYKGLMEELTVGIDNRAKRKGPA